MEPKRNMNTDSNNSQTHSTTSRTTMKSNQDTRKPSTTSQTSVTTNGNKCKEPELERDQPTTLKSSQSAESKRPSIGDQRPPVLRTKDHADHAGPSPPLDLLKPDTTLPLDHSSHSPNNNWLIAHQHTETLDAMEDGWTKPSHTSRPTH